VEKMTNPNRKTRIDQNGIAVALLSLKFERVHPRR
jgi:hypothetical protein